ncbi:CBM_collapsed_G0056330.mRNA.1.CDS.1 [Saccharomyces cerevisiae]|nr:CBM_collapsed_G0056330.mRNA.1.CDS.1 [Saccharomyces cerevisiae]
MQEFQDHASRGSELCRSHEGWFGSLPSFEDIGEGAIWTFRWKCLVTRVELPPILTLPKTPWT